MKSTDSRHIMWCKKQASIQRILDIALQIWYFLEKKKNQGFQKKIENNLSY